MDGLKRPKVNPVRTTMVDTEWDSVTADANAPKPGVVAASANQRREQETIDVTDDDDLTVQRSPDDMRGLLRFEDGNEEDTKVMSPPEDLLRGEHDLDALLASDEEQSLPPPPPGPGERAAPLPARSASRAAGTGRLPDFTARRDADSLLQSSLSPNPEFQPRLPKPPPAPPAPTPVSRISPTPFTDVATAQTAAASPSFSLPTAPYEQKNAELDSQTAYAPPSVPPPRYAARVDADSVVTEERKKGADIARLILVLGITLPLAVGIGVVIGMMVFGGQPETAAAPAAAASVTSTPASSSTTEQPPLSLVDRAAQGDHKALDEIKKRAPEARTARETIALAEGRSANKKLGLDGFAAQIKKNGKLLEDPAQRARLKDFLADRETTNQTALVLLSLDSPLGPDLIYDLWVGTKGKNETTALAEELIYTKEMRQKASPALSVALDLRNATECERVKELLPQAHEHGDRRSLHLLGKLVNKRGCGPQKRDDCWECIRSLEDDDKAVDLVDAIKAVRARASPKL